MKKTVVVTGAGGGMGRAICQMLADDYHIVAIDRNQSKLDVLSHLSHFTPVCSDLTDPELIAKLSKTIEALPPLHGLVNLAGISKGAPVTKITDADWDLSLQTNLTVPMKLVQWIAPKLIEQQSGSIVNVGSPVGIVGANKVSYSASKAALQGLTMSAARELGHHSIRVNMLLPGPTITDMTKDWPQDKQDAIAQGTFLKRLCSPKDIANAITFLLSDKSTFMTGAVLDLTAGSLWGH